MILSGFNQVMRYKSGFFVPFLTVVFVAAVWSQPGPAGAAPKVTVISPSSNQIITEQQTFLLSGQLEDSHGLKSVSIFLNDVALEKRTTRGIQVPAIWRQRLFVWRVSLCFLRTGYNT